MSRCQWMTPTPFSDIKMVLGPRVYDIMHWVYTLCTLSPLTTIAHKCWHPTWTWFICKVSPWTRFLDWQCLKFPVNKPEIVWKSQDNSRSFVCQWSKHSNSQRISENSLWLMFCSNFIQHDCKHINPPSVTVRQFWFYLFLTQIFSKTCWWRQSVAGV